MALWDDEVGTYLKRLKDARREIADSLAQGHIGIENKVGGYIHVVGVVSGLQKAEELFREAFSRWVPGSVQPEDMIEKPAGPLKGYLD